MGLLDYGTPPTWTAADGVRHWSAKVLFPARDAPRWLAIFCAVAIWFVTVRLFLEAYREDDLLVMGFWGLVGGANAAAYVARVVVAVKRPL